MSDQITRMREIHTRRALHHGNMSAYYYRLREEVRDFNPANVASQNFFTECATMHSQIAVRSRIAIVDLKP